MLKAIEIKCKAHPSLSGQKLYEMLQDQDLLATLGSLQHLAPVLKEQGWLTLKKRTDVRKAYEVENVNDLWIADFMHGPRSAPESFRQSDPLRHPR